MIQYAALMWNPKRTKLLQCFGPYRYEGDAQSAVERLQAWPAIADGFWEVVQLHGDPDVSAPAVIPFVPYTPFQYLSGPTWSASPGTTVHQITV